MNPLQRFLAFLLGRREPKHRPRLDALEREVYGRVHTLWAELHAKLKDLEAASDRRTVVGLGQFVDVVNQVSRNFRQVVVSARSRQDLIEVHCHRRETLRLSVHEEYHEVSEQLKGDLVNFFLSCKTCLNHLAILVPEFLPHRYRRGIKHSSFAQLVHTMQTAKFDSSSMERLRFSIIEKGVRIEHSLLEYRDKHIEHPRRLEDITITSAPASPRMLHTAGRAQRSMERTPDSGPVEEGFDYFVLESQNGGKLFYYHVRPSPALAQGQMVEKGWELGQPYDRGRVHFERRGTHVHVFACPDTPISLEELFKIGSDTPITSPDPVETMLLLGGLYSDVFAALHDLLTARTSKTEG